MPNTILALLITLYSFALHGWKSHYKNAEEKNNTRLKSLKVIEAMFCDSIKRALQRKEAENGCEGTHEDEDGENNTLSLMLDVQEYFSADHKKPHRV